MLEGNEVDKTFAQGNGHVIVDVTAEGSVMLTAKYDQAFAYGNVQSMVQVSTDIFKIAETLAARTSTTWDDKAIQGLKDILGIK